MRRLLPPPRTVRWALVRVQVRVRVGLAIPNPNPNPNANANPNPNPNPNQGGPLTEAGVIEAMRGNGPHALGNGSGGGGASSSNGHGAGAHGSLNDSLEAYMTNLSAGAQQLQQPGTRAGSRCILLTNPTPTPTPTPTPSACRYPYPEQVLGGSTVPPHCYLIMPRAEHGSVGELLHTPAVRTLSTPPPQP